MQFIDLFRPKNTVLLDSLAPQKKMQEKILGISISLFILSTLCVDAINAWTGSHLRWEALLLQQSYLMILWAIIYATACKFRSLLKVFLPLYVTLVLFVTTSFVVVNQLSFFWRAQEKTELAVRNLLEDRLNSQLGNKVPLKSQASPFVIEEYGPFAAFLNRFKQAVAFEDEKVLVIEKTAESIHWEEVFASDMLLDFSAILDKKKRLKEYLTLLRETFQEVDDTYSKFITWVTTSSDINEVFRQDFKKGFDEAVEKKKEWKQELYRISEDICEENIKLLDFFIGIYGSYEQDADGSLTFAEEDDLEIYLAQCRSIEKLIRRQERLIFSEQKSQIEANQGLLEVEHPFDNPDPLAPIKNLKPFVFDSTDPFIQQIQRELIALDNAFTEVTLDKILTEEIASDFERINIGKKLLEQKNSLLRKNRERLKKQILEKSQSSIKDSLFTLINQWIAIKEKYILEAQKLLEFLSIRYGTYEKDVYHVWHFAFPLEEKLFNSYLDSFKELSKEEEQTLLLIKKLCEI